MFMYLLVSIIFLVVAFLDRDGKWLLSYPFRQSAIAAFLFMILGLHILVRYIKRQSFRDKLYNWSFVALLLIIIATVIRGYSLHLRNFDFSKESNEMRELAVYIKGNTDTIDVFVLMPEREEFGLDGKNGLIFSRLAKRDPFVSFKFAPIEKGKIREWYKRLKAKEKMLKDWSYIFEMQRGYKINYLIDYEPRYDERLKLVFSIAVYYCYKIL